MAKSKNNASLRHIMSDSTLSKLRQARLMKAARRKHRPCKVCHSPSLLCPKCIRTYCISCHAHCPHCEPQLTLTQGPSRRAVDLMSSKKRPRPTTTRTPEHIVPIPQSFSRFAAAIKAEGGFVSRLGRPDGQGRRQIQVMLPKDASKPKFDSPWHGHKLGSYLNVEPSKVLGLVVETVIEDA